MIDLVIKLREEEYDEILNGIENAEIAGVGLSDLSIALKNGTVLPKGHGRLIDADELEELFREVIGGIAKKPEMSKDLEHMVRASAMTIEMIGDAPTIIEADKEE